MIAVRRKCITGDAHRRISSTAFVISDGSSRSICIWSGCSMRACMPSADRVAGGLVAGDHQQAEIVVVVVLGERTLALGHGQRGDHVVLWFFQPEVPLTVCVLEHLERDGGAEGEVAVLLGVDLVDDRARELGILVADHRVAPADQHRRVLLGDREDRAQEPDRELLGDLQDEVELLLVERPVEHLASDVADEVLVRADAAGAEPLVADVPELAVARRIGLEHRPADRELLIVELLERHRSLSRTRRSANPYGRRPGRRTG